jgi:hypothetical protein
MNRKNIISYVLIACLFLVIHSCAISTFNQVSVLSASHNVASRICLGHVAVTNPIVALLGGVTAALAVVGYNAYKNYVKKESVAIIPDSIILAERFYYEHRKEVLGKIKKELVTIKHDLEMIKGLCSASFTHQLLGRYTYDHIKNVQLVSAHQEKKLSDEQKSTLRKAREAELALLEKHIQDI